MELATLRDLALSLTEDERVILLNDLVLSISPEYQASVDAAWQLEAESRFQAFESGELGSDTWENVQARVKSQHFQSTVAPME